MRAVMSPPKKQPPATGDRLRAEAEKELEALREKVEEVREKVDP